MIPNGNRKQNSKESEPRDYRISGMKSVTRCSFNVENLFMRYKVFGYLPSPKPMRRIYSEEKLKEEGGFLPSPVWKNSFQLYNKGPWRDLTAFAIKRATSLEDRRDTPQ
jgi:hypothetical protein